MILKIERGPQQGQQWEVNKSHLIIGRESSTDIALQDERASRRHTELQWDGYNWTVHDLNSKNGTWVNRQQIYSPYVLQPGDQLGIGQTIITFDDLNTGPENAAAPVYESPTIQHYPAEAITSQNQTAMRIEVVLALASLLLIVGAPLNWISIQLPFLGRIASPGTDGLGIYTLVAGIVTLFDAGLALAFRMLPTQQKPVNKFMHTYLRWISIEPLVISGVLLAVIIYGIIDYNQSNIEYLGIRLNELINPQPEIGLFLTITSLMVIFFVSTTHLVLIGLKKK